MQHLRLKASASFMALWLTACAQTSSPSVEETPSLPPQPKAIGNHYTSQAFMMRGEVVVGHESYYIQPCGTKTQYWLHLPDDLRAALHASASAPYSPLYGELVGHLIPSPVDGFASGHPAQFVVKHVNQLSAESSGCNRLPQPTRAFGAEPAWVIEVNNAQLTIAQIGQQDIHLPVTGIEQHPNQRIYRSDTTSLILDKGTCSDTMSDSIFGWKATVTEAGQSTYLKGCATLDGLDPTLPWVGTYQGKHEQIDLTTTLELNNDHSAITTYQYPTDEPPLSEKGFWQQHSEDSVQVIMTSHNGQRLISERRFQRNGYQLTASEEYVNDQHYSLGEHGLKLDLMVGDAFSAQGKSAQSALTEGDIPTRQDTDSDVEALIRQYVIAHKANPEGLKYQWLTYDLNRDGHDELLVMLDWCGQGGCTLLVFEGNKNEEQNRHWAFSSRISNVHIPISVGYGNTEGWQDLIFAVGGGGAQPASHVIQHNGISYPFNPRQGQQTTGRGNAIATLFADGRYPAQGHTL